MNEVEVIRSGALGGVAHGFLGRRGGVSTGIHAGLNVGIGSDDEPDAVTTNRARAVEAVLPGASHRRSARAAMRWSPTGPACCSAS